MAKGFGLDGAITRRRFLGLSGAALFLYSGSEGLDIGREMLAQERAWSAADADNASFLREHAKTLRNLTIGASFAPEQWRAVEGGDQAALPGYRWAIEELGLREMRLGLRWQRIESTRGRVNIDMYRPFLDRAFERGFPLCLNVGPIRSFRWPEEHLPPWLASTIELPPNGSTVSADSPLAEAAADYLEGLLDLLVSTYGAAGLSELPVVQVENEPFYPMRTHHWMLSSDYVKDRVRQVQRVFPKSRVLITTAGRLNFGPVREVFTQMMAESPAYRDRFVMGFDYHYKTPLRDSFPVIRYTDPITFARVGYQTCEENRDAARDVGYGIEVAEGQAEPNGHLSEPGNSVRHFRFMLLRCAESVLDANRPSVIRIWGIEEMAKKVLAGKATAEHQAIFELIRRINESM